MKNIWFHQTTIVIKNIDFLQIIPRLYEHFVKKHQKLIILMMLGTCFLKKWNKFELFLKGITQKKRF
jgi:hypothetical protein